MEGFLLFVIAVLLACILWREYRHIKEMFRLKDIAEEAIGKAEYHYEKLHRLASTPLDAAILRIAEYPHCWKVYSIVDMVDDGGFVSGLVREYAFDSDDEKEYARRCAEELVEKIKEAM